MLSTIALLSSSRRLGNTGQLIDRIALDLDIEVVDLASRRMSAMTTGIGTETTISSLS